MKTGSELLRTLAIAAAGNKPGHAMAQVPITREEGLELLRLAEQIDQNKPWIDAYGDLQGQIEAMLSRSEKYQLEAETENNLNEGEKHARVCSVLRELKRLASAFRIKASHP